MKKINIILIITGLIMIYFVDISVEIKTKSNLFSVEEPIPNKLIIPELVVAATPPITSKAVKPKTKVIKPKPKKKPKKLSKYVPSTSHMRYIKRFSDVAVDEMLLYGIPASITLAQGIHESNAGNSALALKANNHFGIKCKKNWTGPSFAHKDDDYDKNGNLIKSCFRKYKGPWQSFRDHSKFLGKPRYAHLKSYGNDYKKWAHGLKKQGYATDPLYAEKLIRLIEGLKLDKYDSQ